MTMRESNLGPSISPLEKVVREFGTTPHTPELYTSTFQAIWSANQEILNRAGIAIEFSIPECPLTKEQLLKLEKERRSVGLLPRELFTQESRRFMAIIWPQMQSHSLKEENTVTNKVNRSGWFNYESAIDAPYPNTTEKSLKNAVKKEKRHGMNLNEYIIASQDSKLFTGKYLDETSTWVRLLGSRDGGNVVDARFNADGYLYVRSSRFPRYHSSHLGGRSSEVPKAA